MSAIPTIKVRREGGRGFRLINRDEFDPAVHVALPDDPLDHDADGKKGGSLPGEHRHEPADYEIDGRGLPSKSPAKRTRRKKAG